MEREVKIITMSGIHSFGSNYKLLFEDLKGYKLDYCNITCGINCKIICGWGCNITCGNDCEIFCVGECNITCGSHCQIFCDDFSEVFCGNNCEIKIGTECKIVCENNCEISFGEYCYMKAGERTQIIHDSKLIKTISKDDKHIWWYSDGNLRLINTLLNKKWRKKNTDNFKELYPFVHNELDSANLF